MTDKELRKLSRKELLEMLLVQSSELDKLKEQLIEAKERLEDRKIPIVRAGSILEEARCLNELFDETEKAASQYIMEIEAHTSQSAEIEKESRENAEKIISETQAKCRAIEDETHRKCILALKAAREYAEKNQTK